MPIPHPLMLPSASSAAPRERCTVTAPARPAVTPYRLAAWWGPFAERAAELPWPAAPQGAAVCNRRGPGS